MPSRKLRFLFCLAALVATILACSPSIPEIIDTTYEGAAELEDASATAEARLTAEAGVAAALENSSPSDFVTDCASLSDQECANLGSHSFVLDEITEGSCASSSTGFTIGWTFQFAPEGVQVQHQDWDAPRLYQALGENRYQRTDESSQITLEFLEEGFTLDNNNLDGTDCLFYHFSRQD